MGGAIHRREAADRDGPLSVFNPPPDRAADEGRLVSIAYIVWPLALYEAVVPREEASNWYRFHVRQALWFGIISSAVGFAALLWPLLASLLVTSLPATIWIYALALLIDVVLLAVWLVLAARYSRRASRGELFDVPWVVRLTGATSRKR